MPEKRKGPKHYQKKWIKQLKARRDWLSKRLLTVFDPRDLSFDLHERNALDWAIPILEREIGTNKSPSGEESV